MTTRSTWRCVRLTDSTCPSNLTRFSGLACVLSRKHASSTYSCVLRAQRKRSYERNLLTDHVKPHQSTSPHSTSHHIIPYHIIPQHSTPLHSTPHHTCTHLHCICPILSMVIVWFVIGSSLLWPTTALSQWSGVATTSRLSCLPNVWTTIC